MTDQPRNDDTSIDDPAAVPLAPQGHDFDSGQPAQPQPTPHRPHPQPPRDQTTPIPGQASITKAQEKSWGVWMHVGSMVLGIFPFLSFIAPLAIWLMTKDRSRMLNDHGRSALNWSITYIIFMAFSGALTVVYIGALLLPLGLLAHVILCIMAAVRASQRRKFKHPLAIPFLRVG